MINNFTVQIDDLSFSCNRNFIQSNFPGLDIENNLQIELKIERGKEFYELTKDIFQGSDYEITNDNFDYIFELEKILKSFDIQTKINSFCYKRECDQNQIDQHPSIQFLVELSTLIYKLSISNSEDISQQIIQRIIDPGNKLKKSQNKNKKTKKKKSKNKNDEDDENKELYDSSHELDLNVISKLFYFEIVNCLSSRFQSYEELHQHQQKIELIMHILNELDDDSEEDKKYLDNFIKFVIRKFYQVSSMNSSINNFKQETFYLVYYLLSNNFLSISQLYDSSDTQNHFELEKYKNCPTYFLNFYPQMKLDQYFKKNTHLLSSSNSDGDAINTSKKQTKRRNKKETQSTNTSFEEKITNYLQIHQEKIKDGIPTDNDILNIIINDDLDGLKAYCISKYVDNYYTIEEFENIVIDSYYVPSSIGNFACISCLNESSILELSAYFGSKNIFKYLNEKQLKGLIHRSNNLGSYIIVGRDPQILDIYIDSLKNQREEEKTVSKRPKKEEEEKEPSSDELSSVDTDDPFYFNDDLSNNHYNYDNTNPTNKQKHSTNHLQNEIIAKELQLINEVKSLMKISIERGNFDAYKFLLNELLQYQKDQYLIDYQTLDQYIAKCINKCYFEFVPLLLEQGATASRSLCLFCKQNNELGIDYMIQFSYIDINATYKRKSPLEYCVNNKNTKMALKFLENDKIVLQDIIEPKENEKKRPRKELNQIARSVIVEACSLGLSTIVHYFLEKKLFDIKVISDDKLNLLHLVCKSGDLDTFKEIYQFKDKAMNPNAKVKSGPFRGRTPLHFACISGNLEIVDLLLQQPKININSKDGEGWYPLQYAISNGNADIVSLLLDQEGIQTDIKTKEEENLLHLACRSNHEEIVDMILNSPKVTTSFDLNAKTLKGETPLEIALYKSNFNIISLLINNGVKEGKKNKKKKSSNKQHSEIDLNIMTSTRKVPFIMACELKRVDILELFLGNDTVDINSTASNGKTAIFIACELDLVDVVSTLLKIDGIDLNASTKDGRTPLIAACERGNKNIVELLLNYNDKKMNSIDFNAKTRQGKNALLIACEYPRTDIVELLLKFDEIDCNASSKIGLTPLCIACKNGWENIVDDLIDHGADANFKAFNKSVLYYACLGHNINIIKKILSNIDQYESTLSKRSSKASVGQPSNSFIDEVLKVLPKNDRFDSTYYPPNRHRYYDSDYSDYSDYSDSFSDKSESESDESEGANEDDFINKNDDYDDEDDLDSLKSKLGGSHGSNESSPLFISCMNGDFEIFNLLINANITNDVERRDYCGRTLLFVACEGGNLDIVKTLINKFELDPTITDDNSKTVLHVLCEKNHFEIAEFLINNSPIPLDINDKWNDETPLETACKNGSLEMVQLLLKQDGIEVNLPAKPQVEEEEQNENFYAKLAKKTQPKAPESNEIPPLICACNKWNPEIIKCLIKEAPGLDINVANPSTGETVLHYASKNGDAEICDLILSKNTDAITQPIKFNKTPIQLALENNKVDVLEVFLKYANNDQLNSKFMNGSTLLIEACSKQYQDVVKYLLKNDQIDVNKLDDDGNSPLFVVAKNGNEKICQLLLENNKIEIDQTTKLKTPLYQACKYGNAGVVEMLLKKGAKTDSLTKNGKTPLHVACQHGFYQIVSMLLNCPNVDINLLTIASPTSTFKTLYSPLHYACSNINRYSLGTRPNNFLGRSTFAPNNNFSGRPNFAPNNNFSGRPNFAPNNNFSGIPNFTPNNNFSGIPNFAPNNNFSGIPNFAPNNNFSGIPNFAPNNNFSGIPNFAPNNNFSGIPNLSLNNNNSTRDVIYDNSSFCMERISRGIKKFCVELLLKHSQIDVNLQTSLKETALQIACENKDFTIMNELLQHPQIDTNVKLSNGNTPLHIACDNYRLNLIKMILNNPQTDVNSINNEGQTALSIACDQNRLDVINLLLNHPELKVSIPSQKNPIENAIQKNNREIFNILIHHPSFDVNEFDSKSMTPLGYAIKEQNIDFVHQLLINPNIDINKKFITKEEVKTKSFNRPNNNNNYNSGRFGGFNYNRFNRNNYDYDENDDNSNEALEVLSTPINVVLKLNNYKLMKMLIQYPSLDINAYTNGKTSLQSAVASNNIKLTSLLLSFPSIDVNMITIIDQESITLNTNPRRYNVRNDPFLFGMSPLHIACINRNAEIVKELIKNDDLNVNEYTSADLSRLDQIKVQLYDEYKAKQEALKEQMKKYSQNQLFNEKDFMIEKIENTNLSVEMKNQYPIDCNALYIACCENEEEIVSLLLSRRDIDVNLKSTEEQLTPLLGAIKKGNLKIVELLLSDERCDPSITSLDNINILMYACQSNNINLLAMILSSNGKTLINSKNANGDTPLHFACKSNNVTMVNILLDQAETIEDQQLDLNVKNNDGDTPLHIICQNNNINILNILLEKAEASSKLSFDINAKNNKGETALHLAACYDVPTNLYISSKRPLMNMVYIDDYKKKTIFGILIDHGVDVNCCDNLNQTPLHFACMNQCYNNIDILLNISYILVDGVTDSTPLMALLQTILNYNYKVQTFYENDDSNQDRSGRGFRGNQYLGGNFSGNRFGGNFSGNRFVSNFSGNRFGGNFSGNRFGGNFSGNRFGGGFTRGLSGNRFGNNFSGNNDNNYKVDEEDEDNESKGEVIRKGSFSMPDKATEMIDKFIQHGSKIHLIGKDGITFLLFAIISKVRKYLDMCIDNNDQLEKIINYHSIYGDPIEVAYENWDGSILSKLLEAKKIIKFTDKIREKIIYECITNGSTNLLFILLLLKGDEIQDPNLQFNVNYVDKEKNTPLHLAVQSSDYYAVSLLSNYDKIDLSLYDKEGKTALHRACCVHDSGYMALCILTRIDLNYLYEIYKNREPNPDSGYKPRSFSGSRLGNYKDNSKLFDYLKKQSTEVDSLNPKVDINMPTKGLTRTAFFRREREKILAENPAQKRFHIFFHEPLFNLDYTPLHISISSKNEMAVQKILLYPNLNIKAFTSHCDTPVSLASKNWNEKIIELLLEYPGIDLNFVPKIENDEDDDYDDFGNRIEKKVEEKNEEELKRQAHILTSNDRRQIRYQKMTQNKTLLIAACEQNSINVVKTLLELSKDGTFDVNGVDSFDEMAPLHYICQDHKMELLKLFIQFEKENPNVINWNIPNKNGMTPLHLAARGKYADIVDILINDPLICPHVDINAVATGEFENGRTPLSFACEKGDLETVSLLLDDKQEDSSNPFSFNKIATNNNEGKSIRGSLCDAKSECDVTIKSKAAHQRGMSALHYACKASSVDVVKLLFKHGTFNINLKANGKCCLYLACKHDRVDTVKLLLEQEGIDVNVKTPSGITPLMAACENGRWQIVEMLLKRPEIDVDALTVDGDSARSMAKNQIILDLLDKHA